MTDGLHNQPVPGEEERGAPRVVRPVGTLQPAQAPVSISAEQLHAIIDDHNAVMLMVDPEAGIIVDANRSASRFFGYSPAELRGKKISDISQLPPAQLQATLKRAKEEGVSYFIELLKLANDEVRTVEIHASPVICEDKVVLFAIVHDITEHKLCEEELKTNVASLEELNTALKVILRQVEESREEVSAAIVSNIGELILPNLDKLKKSQLSAYQLSILQSIESSLHTISSTFLQKLRITHHKLSAREIEIAALVKEGKSTKEIAERVHISTKTVEFHRNRLRGKLGLKKKKVNLRSHLLSIK
ncbi:MAG: PAS domain S-box protein [Syntrophales bacterium]